MRCVLLVLLSLVSLSSCASSGRVVQVNDASINGPKVIALDAPSAPWVIEIQNRLKQHGFKVLRWSSRTRVAEKTAANRLEQYNQAEARYVLVIDGFAPYDYMHRCFGGGYNFQYISADLVDTASNETILNVNGSGYSENCPPMSGTIFTDITDAVVQAWK